MSAISQIIASRRASYTRILKTSSEWCSKRSSMNGTSDKYIRTMIQQVLKELAIPATASVSIINAIYTRDFDATRLANRAAEQSKSNFDLLSKDESTRQRSIDAALYALNYCKISISSYNNIQLAGLCIFVQFILCGGRADYQGFGSATNLIEKWKKINRDRKVAENKRLIEEQKAKLEEMQTKTLNESVVETVPEKITPISEEIPTSWEDL
tara:strand:+ start:205 stop:840 length:636 start_codon:yes stop_codon:yes gene_type:complete